jgi:D-serine dehydratase
MKTNEMIRKVIKANKVPLLSAARAAGVVQATMSYYLAGRHDMKSEAVFRLLKFLHDSGCIDSYVLDPVNRACVQIDARVVPKAKALQANTADVN